MRIAFENQKAGRGKKQSEHCHRTQNAPFRSARNKFGEAEKARMLVVEFSS